MKSSSKSLIQLKWILLIAVGYLISLSFVILYSIARTNSTLQISMLSQWIALGAGMIGFLISSRLQSNTLKRSSPALYLASLAGLVLVMVAGSTIQGSQRWIDVGFVQFQPSELIKVSLVLVLATLAFKLQSKINQPKNLLIYGIAAIIPICLVLLQPDLGTSILLILTSVVILFASKLKKQYIAAIIGFGLMAILVAVPLLADYQKDRLDSFLGGPAAQSYNVRQSIITIGSGGLAGQGLSAGSQSQLNFLPSQHTDFVFAVTAEKLGFIGALSVVLCEAVIVLSILRAAITAKSDFWMYVALGLATFFGLQILINIGMNLGVAPVTGLPLPFMSYGGTHLVIELVAVGLVYNILKD